MVTNRALFLVEAFIIKFYTVNIFFTYRAKSQLGSCVRVDDTIRQALHKTILLFSLPTMAFDMDEPQSIM